MLKYGVMLGVLALLLTAYTIHSQEKGIIIINNDSDYLLSDVKAKYTSAKRVDALGNLPAHTSYTYKIHYTDSEDSVSIHYTDHEQRTRSVTAVPYAGKYDKQRYVVNIN
ncbi:hypothetical protein [Psychrobacter alimentarius]|uniref:hypothetical protein n=1 Tax=Psychrobacter alimentarius TaxID=261164 RepID=UPI003FCF606E